jgi:hypothetical protein
MFRRAIMKPVTRRILLTAVLGALLAAPQQAQTRFTSFAEVRNVLSRLADVLPPELKVPNASDAERAWMPWVQRQDRAIRSRLQRGDEETIVNWLLFGTTFTKLPRVPLNSAEQVTDDEQRTKLIAARTVELANALATPGQDERRLFARELFAKQGYGAGTPAERTRLAGHLADLVQGVLTERAEITRELQTAGRAGSTSDQFAARSRVFRDRGLSLDTSFRPSFALEQALAQLRQRGLLKPGTIRDVAVIGPGLDFTDKTSGFDFYPQQTLQPFALIDSLLRVGVIKDPASIRLTTLDISPRVNDHLRRARQRASAGESYRFRLPLDRDVKWKAPAVEYWKIAGDRVGRAAPASRATLAGATVDVRIVTVRPAVTLRIEPLDLNVVLQRSATHQFDLVVATNVFVYYDVLEQVLALSNVRAMLKPGGLLLSNNALLELAESGMRSIGYVTTEYSEARDDGDHIVFYQAQ